MYVSVAAWCSACVCMLVLLHGVQYVYVCWCRCMVFSMCMYVGVAAWCSACAWMYTYGICLHVYVYQFGNVVHILRSPIGNVCMAVMG